MKLNLITLNEVGPTRGATGHPVPRDGRDRPLVIPIEGGKPIALTRMTTHAGTLEDTTNLTKYAKRNVLIGSTVLTVAELNHVKRVGGLLKHDDPEHVKTAKQELNRMADRAEDLSGANDKRERGTHLHDLSEYVDRGEPLPPHATDADRRDMEAYAEKTSMLMHTHIEKLVVCRELKVSGTPDRVSLYDGLDPDGNPAGNLITDLKTGSVEYGELKMAQQLAGYSRGKFYDPSHFPLPDHNWAIEKEHRAVIAQWKKTTEATPEQARAAYADLPDVNQNWGLIFHLPAGTGVCTVYWINLQVGWAAAQLSSAVREARSKKVLVPFVA